MGSRDGRHGRSLFLGSIVFLGEDKRNDGISRAAHHSNDRIVHRILNGKLVARFIIFVVTLCVSRSDGHTLHIHSFAHSLRIDKLCHLFSSYFVRVISYPRCPSPISFPLTFCPNLPSSFIVSLTSSSDLSTISRIVSRLVSSCPFIGYLLVIDVVVIAIV